MSHRTVAAITTDHRQANYNRAFIISIALNTGLSLATCTENNLLFQNRVDARPSN